MAKTKPVHDSASMLGANVSVTTHLIKTLVAAGVLSDRQAKRIFNKAVLDHRTPGTPEAQGRETRKLIKEQRRRALARE